MHALNVSAKFMQRGQTPFSFTSGITTISVLVWYKCPYLHTPNVHTHFGTNVQNDNNSTYLTLSVLKIVNPKGKSPMCQGFR